MRRALHSSAYTSAQHDPEWENSGNNVVVVVVVPLLLLLGTKTIKQEKKGER